MPEGPPGSAQSLVRVRLSVLYALSFGALGAVFPYMAFELQEAGVGGWLLMAALAASPTLRLFAGPLWGMVADRFRVAPGVLRLGAALAAAGTLLLAWRPALALPGALLMALGRAPLDTMLEGMTLQALGADQVAYGRIRLWGSLGFLAAALSGGLLVEGGMVTPLELGAVLALLTLAMVTALPRTGGFEPAPIGPALRALWRHREVPWFLLASALHFLSHAGATTFLAVHVRSLGAPQRWTGLALAVGVATEILLMARVRTLFTRWSPASIFLFSVLMGLPRWLLSAFLLHPVAVVLLQALHGITFGAFWVSAVARLGRWAPPEVRTSAQGVLGAAVAGVGALGGTTLGSWLIERWPTDRVFLVMAGVSVLAIAAAWKARDRAEPGVAP